MNTLTSLLFDAAARCNECLDRDAGAVRQVRDPSVLFHIAWRNDSSPHALRDTARDCASAPRRYAA